MSSVAQIITKIRQRSQTRASEMSDILPYLNDNYKKLRRKITNIDKNFGRAFWNQNIVAGQNEYPLTYGSTGGVIPVFGQMKIENVGVRISPNNTTIVRLEERDWDNMKHDRSYYETDYLGEPFYILSRNSLFIYPTPKEAISGGIRLEGSKRQYDLTLSSVETDILVEPDYHHILEIMTTIDVARIRQRYDLAQEHENKLTIELDDMMKEIKKRVTRPVQGKIPFLD